MTMPEMIVAVDTREKRPYLFPHYEVKTLSTGDYSIVGMEDKVAIERKEKSDAYASLGKERARFEREMERLAQLDYGAIVIESSLHDFLTVPAYSRMNPISAVNSLIAWSVRYRVHVYFADDRRLGNNLTLRILEKYMIYNRRKSDAG